MRVPQVSERIKEAPAQALRGVFAGIGQLLLITDKLRHKAPSVPVTRRPEPTATVAKPETETPARPPAAEAAPAQATRPAVRKSPNPVKAPQPRDFDKTGNVRLLKDEVPAMVDREPGAPGAPLANYDELSIASLRARLRNLDVAQLRQLTEYERAHEARAEVIGMFERRIAKLEAEG